MLERLTRNLAPLTVAAAALAFLYPPLFTSFGAVFLELFAVWCVITGAGVTGLFRRRVLGAATP